MGAKADPLKLANPTKATRAAGVAKAKARNKKKDLDKKKKASDKMKKNRALFLAELKAHRKLGWDGKGSIKPDLQLRGNIMWPTKDSKKKYRPWKSKLDRLEKKLIKAGHSKAKTKYGVD